MVKHHDKFIDKITSGKEGITIISLVVTIVVICILVGVTLNVTIGDNGVIKQAKLLSNNIAQSEEEAQMQINVINSSKEQNYGTQTLNDTSSPNMSMTVTSNAIVVGVTITETQSGLDRIEYSIDNGQTWVTNPANKTAKQYTFTNLEPGIYTAKARAYDNNGNITEELSGEVKLGYPMPDQGTYQYGEFGSGSDENGEYYSIHVPEGIYYSYGNEWAPEARISAQELKEALGISANKIVEGETIAGVEGTAKKLDQTTRLTFSNNLYGDIKDKDQSTGNITLTNLPYSSMQIVSSNCATATYENGTLKILFDSKNTSWTNNNGEENTIPSITIDLIP